MAAVSIDQQPGSPITGNGLSTGGSVSADGRYTVYSSVARNLVIGQQDPQVNTTDLFLFDNVANTTTLLTGSRGSATVTGLPRINGTEGNLTDTAVISADGRYVAFTSLASDLTAGQTESEGDFNLGYMDLFLYEVQTGTTTLITHSSADPNRPARHGGVLGVPSISADGRYVAFASKATNLLPSFTYTSAQVQSQIYLYDRGTAATPASLSLVTHAADSLTTPADFGFSPRRAEYPVLSADGRYVAYQSNAKNLVTNQADSSFNPFSQVFLYDAVTQTNTLLSGVNESSTLAPDSQSSGPLSISAHGRFVTFYSSATNLIPGQVDTNNGADVFLFDRDAGAGAGRLRLVSHVQGSAVTSGNAASGNTSGGGFTPAAVINVNLATSSDDPNLLFVAFLSNATNLAAGVTDSNSTRDLFHYTVSNGTNRLVSHVAGDLSRTANGEVDGFVTRGPVISGDGRFVAYSSTGTTLVTGQSDSNSANDIFLYDSRDRSNTLISGSSGSATQTGNGASNINAISNNGASVVFTSAATNLVSGGDTNANTDVFRSVTPVILTYDGKLQDRLARFDPTPADFVRPYQVDGDLDGTFTVKLAPELGARTVTSLVLDREDGNLWNTTYNDGVWLLGAAPALDQGLFNAFFLQGSTIPASGPFPGEVRFDVAAGGSFRVFAPDFAGASEILAPGKSFTLTIGFSDGSTASASVQTPAPLIVDTLSDVFNDDFSAGNLTLREALFLANLTPARDTIEFDPSLSGASSVIRLTHGELKITSDVTIKGPGASLLAVSGDGDSNGIGESRIFNIDNNDFETLLKVSISGLKLIKGNADFGGAILNLEDLTVADAVLTNNVAQFSGGAIYNDEGVLTVEASQISGNSAALGGGGVFNVGTLTFSETTVHGNSSESGAGLFHSSGSAALTSSLIDGNIATSFEDSAVGGGIFNNDTMTISTSTVSNNRTIKAESDNIENVVGGGLLNSGHLTITESVITRNGSQGSGGGIFNTGVLLMRADTVSHNTSPVRGGGIENAGELFIEETTIDQNIAGQGGGVSNYFSGVTRIVGSTITKNLALIGGGVSSSVDSENTAEFAMQIVNSTVANNEATIAGGGILNRFGGLVVTNSTISGNLAFLTSDLGVASAAGGGVFNGDPNNAGTTPPPDSNLRVVIRNSIVVGNRQSNSVGDIVPSDLDNQGVMDISNSLIGDAATSGGNINGENGNIVGVSLSNVLKTVQSVEVINGTVTEIPVTLPALQNNGGLTQTIRLASGSPAINAGRALATLDAAVSPTATSVEVVDTMFLSVGQLIRIDSEVLLVNSITNNTLTVLRGQSGTAAANHAARASVHLAFDQRGSGFNRLAGARVDLGAFEVPPIVVTTLEDVVDTLPASVEFLTGNPGTDGKISLREAIAAANNTPGVDTIAFDPALTSSGSATLRLNGMELFIRSDLSIEGPGANLLTINGDSNDADAIGNSRIFLVDDNNFNGKSNVTISGLTLSNGQAVGSEEAGLGGAIRNVENLTLKDSVITGNTASSDGGGIANSFGRLTIANTTISNNVAGAGGGGLHNNGAGTVTVTNASVFGNTSQRGGGGVFSADNTNVTIMSSNISNNVDSGSASQSFGGGGVLMFFGNLSITNSTLSGNRASVGGGASTFQATATLTNVTIAGNTATSDGGGLNSNGTVSLRNSLVAGNFKSGAPNDIIGELLGPDNQHNLVGDAATAGGLVDGVNRNIVGVNYVSVMETFSDSFAIRRPLLGNNGGATETIALLATSPAINAGRTALLPSDVFDLDGDGDLSETVPLDQRGNGFSRSIGPNTDIGAFEAPPRHTIAVTTTADVVNGSVVSLDHLFADPGPDGVSLREAIEAANATEGADTITFAASLTPGSSGMTTIRLNGTRLNVRSDLTITGPGANRLTIDGDTDGVLDPVNVESNGNSRLFNVDDGNSNTIATVMISGLTLSHGNLSAGGGAIFNRENLTLANAIVTQNFGGGINNDVGTLTIRNSTISDNVSAQSGAGVASNLGVVKIRNSTISNNRTSLDGGGISSTGDVTVIESTISGNAAGQDAGGIGNAGSLNVVASTISGNSAGRDGGGIGSVGTLVVTQSTISGNTASNNSGGIGIGETGEAIIQQTTITRNLAGFAGAGLGMLGPVVLTNSIIAGNTTTVVSGSTTSNVPDDVVGLVSLGADSRHNLIGSSDRANGLLNGVNGNIVGANVSAVLGSSLADNGGPTKTHALLANSPAINAGNGLLLPIDKFDLDSDGNVADELSFDQRGRDFVRVFGNAPDIGAFEFTPPPVLVTVAVSPASVVENGTNNLVFTFTRSVTTGSLVANFQISGTATQNGNDYIASGASVFSGPAGTVTFENGQATKTVTIDPTGDDVAEANETVVLNVLPGNGYQPGLADSATGTIANDDTSFTIAATSADKAEGNTSTTPFTFTVTRSGVATGKGSVKYTLKMPTNDALRPPAQPADFSGVTTGTVTFAENDVEPKVITINVVGDSKVEGDEFFDVELSSPVGGSIPNTAKTASGVIRNDDATFGIFPTTVSVPIATSMTLEEGNPLNPEMPFTEFVFQVNRFGFTAGAARIDYEVIPNGTGTAAANDADFKDGVFPRGSIDLQGGEVGKTVTINVRRDTLVEAKEGFFVRLLDSSLGGVPDPAFRACAGFILNDDTSSLSIEATAARKPEGNLTNGNPTVTPFTFTVRRLGTATGMASARFSVVPGNGAIRANADDIMGGNPDPNQPIQTGNVFFAANETSKVITINVRGDTSVESDETFDVVLSDLTGVGEGIMSATGTIQSDDSMYFIAPANPFDHPTKPEGGLVANGVTNKNFGFTVFRVGGTLGTPSVNYEIKFDGTNAANAADFASALKGSVKFKKEGDLSVPININVKDDTIQESDEQFQVMISGTGLNISTATATGIILNDDSTLAITNELISRPEGNSGQTEYQFTVTRTGATITPASVKYTIAGSTLVPDSPGSSIKAAAAKDDDFAAKTGPVTFEKGETTKTLSVLVNGDTIVEGNEGFSVTLSGVAGASLGTSVALGRIETDDTALAIAPTVAANATQVEGNDGFRTFSFTVTRTGMLSGETSVNYAVESTGTNPTNADDFVPGEPTSGTLVFTPTEMSKTITIKVAGDTSVEPTETFLVRLSNPVGASGLSVETAQATITSDDSSFSIVPIDARKAEGNSGNTPFTFTVSRNGGTLGNASVNYLLNFNGDHPAEAKDFGTVIPPAGAIVSFKPGETSKIVTINVKGDAEFEPDEDFTVTLVNEIGGVLIPETKSATGMILSDDATIGFTNSTLNLIREEGTSSTPPLTPTFEFDVTRTGGINVPASVKYVVTPNGSGASAANAADFGTAFPSGTINFAAGFTAVTIPIKVIGDSTIEGDEGFKITLSTMTGTVLGTAFGTIRNDDSLLSIAATDPKGTPKAEGNPGDAAATLFTFTVTRTGNLRTACQFDYQIAGTGSDPAKAANEEDFVNPAALTGTLTLAENVSSTVITVEVARDLKFELDEVFAVTLINPVSTTLGTSSATATIKNDDSGISISPAIVSLAEGNPTGATGGFTTFTFTVTRTGVTTGAASVGFIVEGDGENPTDDGDFDGGNSPSGRVEFRASETSKTISVKVQKDTELEPEETFIVKLVDPIVGASLITDTATGKIVSDDILYSIEPEVSDASEGGDPELGGPGVVSFIIRREGVISGASSVTYRLGAPVVDPESPAPVASGSDFVSGFGTIGTVSFLANQTEKRISFSIRNDTAVEGDEQFVVTLLAQPNGSINADLGSVLGTIFDDDEPIDNGEDPFPID